MGALALSYIVALVVFVGVDFVWLSRMADKVYRPAMGDMVLPGFRAAPAIVFYLIYAAGMVFFAVVPGIEANHWTLAAGRGALFGLCAYATYDLTNQATLKHWSTKLSVIDTCWGAVLTGVASGSAAAAGLAISR